jgi:hypothetical protein
MYSLVIAPEIETFLSSSVKSFRYVCVCLISYIYIYMFYGSYVKVFIKHSFRKVKKMVIFLCLINQASRHEDVLEIKL